MRGALMDRAALDRLYNNRAAVPTHQEDLARWSETTAAARRTYPAQFDLRYGPDPREALDFFSVPEPGKPLVVFIHGGYWQALSKDELGFVAEGFVSEAAGHMANVALLNYPLAPAADMDGIADSIRRGLAWLWGEAEHLRFDRNRIYICGHSAGGHLTVMTTLTDWREIGPDLPSDLVKGGLSLSGLYDLRPIRHTYLNEKLGMDDAQAERNSPLLLLSGFRGELPPLLLAVGADETAAFHEQQHEFVTACKRRGEKVTAITVPGKHHFNIVDELAKPGSAVQGAFARLLQEEGT